MAFQLQPITDFQRDVFSKTLEHAVQQIHSKYDPFCVIDRNATGKSKEYNFVEPTDLEESTNQRFERVTLSEMDYFKRRITPRFFDKYIGFDKDDPIFLDGLDSPVATAINSFTPAYNRTLDDILMGMNKTSSGYAKGQGGIFGTNWIGEGGNTMAELDDSLKIEAGALGTTADAKTLTIAKLNRAITLFQENEYIDDAANQYGDQICMAITPRLREDLINDEKLQKIEYGFQALRDPAGTIKPIMGIQFRITNKLPKDANGNIICPVWMKSKLQLVSWKDKTIEVKDRPDLKKTIQVSCHMIAGACRKDEKAFIQVVCTPKS